MATSPSKLLFLPGAGANPNLPRWFLDAPISPPGWPSCACPCCCSISPVRVGQRLAELYVFPGGGHDLGFTHAAEVAELIDRHLARG